MNRISPLAWLLMCLVVALMVAVGIRLPIGDTASALLALVVAGLVYRKRSVR